MSELAAALAKRRGADVSDIQDSKIFLGPGRCAADREELSKRGITHILNVADDVPNYHESDDATLTYLCLGVGDFGADAGISRTFDAAASFVRDALASDGRVLIHCANGSNRSPTVTIAVLMILHGWDLATAWEHVLSRRPGALPLQDNRQQLLRFELTRGHQTMQDGNNATLVRIASPTPLA